MSQIFQITLRDGATLRAASVSLVDIDQDTTRLRVEQVEHGEAFIDPARVASVGIVEHPMMTRGGGKMGFGG